MSEGVGRVRSHSAPLPQRRSGIVTLAAAGLLAVTAAGCGGGGAPSSSAGSNQLIINSFGGSWGSAIQTGLINGFERKTGIHVTLLATDDPAKSELAIQHGDPPPEDIIDYDFPTEAGLAAKGLLAPIDYKDFSSQTLAEIPSWAKTKYGVGWGSFAIGICYNKKDFPHGGPTTWQDFWNFKKYPGKRGMLAWPAQLQPEFGLLADGTPVSGLYPINTAKAFAALNVLKSHVPQFPSDPSVLDQQLVSGEVSAEACYTHRMQTLINQGLKNVVISYNQAMIITDYFMVWKTAPHLANAMKFLAYAMQKAPQLKWAEAGNTAPVNPAAFSLLPKNQMYKYATAPQYRPKEFLYNEQWYARVTGGVTNEQRIINEWTNKMGA
jgi:putative spermidine/putrescine transport system substrate-binding protein